MSTSGFETLQGEYRLFTRIDPLRKTYAGRLLLFDHQGFLLDRIVDDVSGKSRVVKLRDYAIYKNLKEIEEWGPQSEGVVYSLYSGGLYLADIVKSNKDHLFFVYKNHIYEMEFLSELNQASFAQKTEGKDTLGIHPVHESVEPASLFLGVRRIQKDKETSYRTYFLYADSGHLDIYVANGLVFPGKNGYRRVGVQQETVGGMTSDVLRVEYAADLRQFQQEFGNTRDDRTGIYRRRMLISYVTPNFISMEEGTKVPDQKGNVRVQYIDKRGNAPFVRWLNIRELLGDETDHLFDSYFQDRPHQQRYIWDATSLGIRRQNGYRQWFTRVWGKGEDGKYQPLDIPVRELSSVFASEDTPRSVTMEEINSFYASARDYVSSPTRNLAVVKVGESFRIIRPMENFGHMRELFAIDWKDSNIVMDIWSVGVEAEVQRFFIHEAPVFAKLEELIFEGR